MTAGDLTMGGRYRTLRPLRVCITPAMGLEEGKEAHRLIDLPAGERFAIGQPSGQPDIAVCSPLGPDVYERLVDPHVPAEWRDDEYYVGCLMLVKVTDIAEGCEFLGGYEPEPEDPRAVLRKLEVVKAAGGMTAPAAVAELDAMLATYRAKVDAAGAAEPDPADG